MIPHFGYRAHAVLVCVARSCPALQRFAYTREELDEQVNGTFREKLAREDLNRFFPEENRVEIQPSAAVYDATSFSGSPGKTSFQPPANGAVAAGVLIAASVGSPASGKASE